MIRQLTEEQCLTAIQKGEFGEDVLGAAPSVAIVLTQHWCPQWTWMRSYLEALSISTEEAVFFVEYDRENFYEEFLAYKEDTLGNREIPYVRFYRNGRLTSTSNFIPKDIFSRRMRGTMEPQ